MFNSGKEKKDVTLLAALISLTLWILMAYMGEHWLSQHGFARIFYLSIPPATALVVILLKKADAAPVLKEFAREWWRTVWTYTALVSLSAVLVLIICSAVGYLPYSDRPGPGWGHIPSHIPRLQEIGYFLGWAILLLPICYFSGSLLFVSMAWLKWLDTPVWLARSLGGLFSAAFGMLAVAGAGWYIAISPSVGNIVAIMCLIFGSWVLPRAVSPKVAALSLSARVLGIALVFVFMTTILIYPFLQR